MRRREFIAGLGAVAWPLTARAQQRALPVIGLVSGRSSDDSALYGAAFRKGLSEAGYIDGQNVTIEYHWLDGRYDHVPSLMAYLVRRRVAVIATPANPVTHAARAARRSGSFSASAKNPVKLGLVASLARLGSNATGINFLATEVVAKRLGLLHELMPRAVRIAVLSTRPTPRATDPRYETYGKPQAPSG